MGFRENLLKKIEIKQLTGQVLGSIVPNDSSKRIDLDAMRRLLEMGPYHYRRERDLDLYCENAGDDRQMIIVLDNELKIYHTDVEDVALRKSPTTKEMVNIRNAIKILNDKKVVVSRKGDTVQQVRSRLIDALDLSFSATDIEALVKDGSDALQNNYADGVVETLSLFAELLGYKKASKSFRLAHHQAWGKLKKGRPGEVIFGPAVLFSLVRNSVAILHQAISSLDKEGLNRFQQVAKGEIDGDHSGADVFEYLRKEVMAKGPATA